MTFIKSTKLMDELSSTIMRRGCVICDDVTEDDGGASNESSGDNS